MDNIVIINNFSNSNSNCNCNKAASNPIFWESFLLQS